MNILLWICQGLLSILFLYSGAFKAIKSEKQLVQMGQTGVKGLSYPLIRFIAVMELLGSLGITLPWALCIYKILTPVAAFGFALIMALAIFKHIQLKESKTALGNLAVMMVCLFVAILRLRQLY
jgi:DoxX-like family